MSTAADLQNIPVTAVLKADFAKHEALPTYDGLSAEQRDARLAMRSKAVQEALALLSLTGTLVSRARL